jgi:hypothetical protein
MVFSEGNESSRHKLLGIKENRQGREEYRMARKSLFKRCICI